VYLYTKTGNAMLRLIGFYMEEDAELSTSGINLKPTFYGSLQIKMFHIGV
jgi:hypothetical protein